jgi:hypothetical protein
MLTQYERHAQALPALSASFAPLIPPQIDSDFRVIRQKKSGLCRPIGLANCLVMVPAAVERSIADVCCLALHQPGAFEPVGVSYRLNGKLVDRCGFTMETGGHEIASIQFGASTFQDHLHSTMHIVYANCIK